MYNEENITFIILLLDNKEVSVLNQINGNPTSIQTLFNNRYTVQYYQREYSWGRKQIEELVEDLTSEFLEFYEEEDVREDVEIYGKYFLGPIILTSDNAIIDGQQRLTSLTLLLIYLNNLQKGFSNKVNVDHYIFSEKFGRKTFSINVPEREECLTSLFEQGDFDLANEESESVINIYNRYKDIEELYPEDLESKTALPLFIEWLIYNIILIQITTTTEQDAHKVFVAMNDRGLRLTPTEMLKGYLLSEIDNNSDRNKANDLWKEKVLTLKEIEKDGDAEFIKNWLRSQYAETIREGRKGSENKDFEIIGDPFHKWVRENSNRIGLKAAADYEQFIRQEFDKFTDIYIRLKKYANEFHKEYEHVFYNANRNFTLQYLIILASIDIDDDEETINKKIKLVSCFIDQFIAIRVFNFRTLNYSSIRYTVFTITKDIRRKSVNELVTYIKSYIGSMEMDLEEIDEFYLNQYTRRYMLHILSRMTYFIEQESGMYSSFADYVDRNQKNPYDIEHIWANDYTQGNHKNEFNTEEEFAHFRNQFGGLLILSKDKNRSFQSMGYDKKVVKYDSENLLARTLNENCYSNNPLFLRFKEEGNLSFKPYSSFGKTDLIERQLLYKEICKRVWDPNLFDQIANS